MREIIVINYICSFFFHITGSDSFQVFSILFTAIFFEGFPFIILGSLISSIIHFYVTEEHIIRIIPSNRYFSIIISALTGLVFPLCECGIVSVIKRLMEKKVPIHVCITLLTSIPIVNPVVILTTFLAFPDRLDIVIIRATAGFTISVMIGIIASFIFSGKDTDQLLKKLPADRHQNCTHCRLEKRSAAGKQNRFFQIIDHAGHELYNIGRFFIAGAFLASLFRTFISEKHFLIFTENSLLPIITMIFLAYVLSVCSETDAFIARKFIGILPDSAIMGFMLVGPMIDLKNTILLLNLFKAKTAFIFVSIILLTCFLSVLFLNNFIM